TRRQCSRAMAIGRQTEEPRLDAFLLCGDASAGRWLGPVLRDEQSVQSYGRLLLSSGARPPAALPARSPQVCACMNVDEARIQSMLGVCEGSAHERLSQLKSSLGCGTRCGSCIPRIKQLVHVTPAPQAAVPPVDA
ncbi:(2Fe-2S)-binding protein, partial [Comamonas sp.]